jgi:predicted Zn-dependent protease with MMP-like domain
VEVAAAADTTVVLEAPEMGDEIQAIKAGLLEVADLVVVNKGDRPGAGRAAAQLRAMLGQVEVLVTTATTGDGVPALLAALDVHRANGSATAGRAGNRQARAAALVWALLGDRVRELLTGPGTAAATTAALEAVATHSLDPYAAADRLLATLTGRASPAPDPEDAARAAFEALVEAAIAAIPEPFTAELASVAFVVEDEPLPGQAPPGGTLFGLYQGVPRTAWGAASAAHAARITIYRRAHERWYRDPRARARAVAATVRHEVAHHLGISDERLGQLANEHGR